MNVIVHLGVGLEEYVHFVHVWWTTAEKVMVQPLVGKKVIGSSMLDRDLAQSGGRVPWSERFVAGTTAETAHARIGANSS